MSEVDFTIRPLEREDREWVAHFMDEYWGTTQIVSRGQTHYGHLLPGLVAERTGNQSDEGEDEAADDAAEPLGLITYHIVGDACEITTLNSLDEHRGVGSALVEALIATIKELGGIRRIWLITTNDNLNALRFWQKREFTLVTIHRDAIQESRRIKPQIPIIGQDGIPIRDEIELEYNL
ncbi:GNAT family N-acetyltransferase [Phototrophicus methaneseepsis]|uniref:GNAT family N-acetyltransferase n=1 Tax=Phototrophicus methaneseepsis TaxID=2710758 RepID=A0A7S8IFN1_9CHLR|nr:GNAT family N-acetyltransferase [Phototrophicus methaneseepsis]QPC84900.1 GNAT family N-acetyltransferase [Phototrophicus methaneseepsis]